MSTEHSTEYSLRQQVALTGNMRIVNDDGSGEINFSVEEYKRPKFEVDFNPVVASFRLNDVIQTEGFARAYSGASIDGCCGQVSCGACG